MVTASGEESMHWKFRKTQQPRNKKAKTQEGSYPERREDYITLVLMALLVSMFLTGLIAPQLASSPFF